jgi:hypothetical protein
MHPTQTRIAALAMLAQGRSLNSVSRHFAVSRSALREWRDQGVEGQTRPRDCPRCEPGDASLDERDYSALLGYYLGDGCVSAVRSFYTLRVSCDERYDGIIADVSALIQAAHPMGRICRVRAPGAVVVQSAWKHWPCLLPQHGPGRKHERKLALEPWQQAIVTAHPADFLRGLFHSDGSRSNNWATCTVAGERKRYDYPRWQFTNVSADIQGFCTDALDLVGIPWRRSYWKTISVSTRAGVARLDELIGLKS